MKKDFEWDEEWEEERETEEMEEEQWERPGRRQAEEPIDSEKVRILVKVVPFVLIILILAVTLLVNAVRKNAQGQEEEDLQESIRNYADSNLPTDTDPAKEDSNLVTAAETPSPLAGASASPSASPTKASATPTPYQEVMEASVDYSKISFDADENLKEMMTYWADNNQKALDDLAALDWFRAMSYSLKGTTDFYYYGDVNGNGQPEGTGIAVYADNQYYYGSWSGGVRSGTGTWIHYHVHETSRQNTDLYTYHQYTGSWKGDLPDGEGSEHYDYNTGLLKENTGYNNNLIGSYSAGLINGEFYITNIYSDGNVKEWYADAVNGSWVYCNDNKDTMGRRPIQVEDRNEENFIWMLPADNQNIGVPCLISRYKN